MPGEACGALCMYLHGPELSLKAKKQAAGLRSRRVSRYQEEQKNTSPELDLSPSRLLRSEVKCQQTIFASFIINYCY